VTNAAGDSTSQTVTVATVAAPSITSFSAAKSIVTTGKGTTLSATFADGTGAIEGLGAVLSGTPIATGNLAASRDFALTVTNAAGDSTSQTVTVTAVAAPSITSFSAVKSIVTTGKGTTLSAIFADGTAVIEGLGVVLSGTPIATGNLAASRDFVLTVTNAAGDSTTQTVTVTAVAAPSITSFSAAKNPVTTGRGTTLTAIFADGTGAIEGLGAVLSGTPIATGNLAASRSFILTVTNAAGDSTSQAVTVTAVAAPSITSFSAAKSIVTTGKGTTLTAIFADGTAVIEGLGVVLSGTPIATGNLAASRSFILTVTNAAGDSTSQTVSVATVAAPSITSFSAAKSIVTIGKGTTLSATFMDGMGAIDGLGPVTAGMPVATGNLAASKDFALTVTNAAGDGITQTISVSAVDAPSIVSFTAAKNPVTAGTSTTLTAIFGHGTGAIQGLGPVSSGTPLGTSSLLAASDFVLTVTNAAGDNVTQTLNVVTIPAPVITRFASSLGQVFPGQGIQLTATYSGGTGVVDPLQSTLASDSSLAVLPAITTTYTLTVTNAVGDNTSASVLVYVDTDPVAITAFTCGNPVVDYGTSTELDWSINGRPTSLTLNGTSVLGDPAYQTVFPVRRNAYTLAGANPLGSDSRTQYVYARGLDILAGSVGGPGNVDGAGTLARFSIPYCVAAAPDGSAFVADTGNHVIRKIDPSGNVTTYAGSPGVSGATDGPVATARFYAPQGVAVDASGTLYVADTNNSTIRRISPDGMVSTLAGLARTPGSSDGSGSNARFHFPAGLAVNALGTVYVADEFNATIRVLTPGGTVSTLAGSPGQIGTVNGTGAAARFCTPRNLALDGSGNIIVADSDFNVIRRVTPDGVVSTVAGAGGSAAWSGYQDGTTLSARFYKPYGVAVDGAGNIYVADEGNHVIRKITPAGAVSTLAGAYAMGNGCVNGPGAIARFFTPSCLAFTNDGSLLVTEFGNSDVRKVSLAGFTSTLAGQPGLAPSTAGTSGTTDPIAYFSASPQGLAADASGNIYVADTTVHAIRKVTPAGIISNYAGNFNSKGSTDGSASAAKFSNPRGLAMDSAGNLYVADTGNHVIRKITPTGLVSTFAGLAGSSGSTDGAGTTARFYGPTGVAVDAAGNVYVADSSNSTVRKISPAGLVSTLAGTAGSYTYWDGMGGGFSVPEGIACDASGNIYVTEANNMAIRKITPAGQVSTLAGQASVAGYVDATGSAARFGSLYGLVVDSQGNIYVADTTNNAIRKITPAGEVTTTAGAPGKVGVKPGILPASLYQPYAVTMDRNGDLYLTTSNGVAVITAPSPLVSH